MQFAVPFAALWAKEMLCVPRPFITNFIVLSLFTPFYQ